MPTACPTGPEESPHSTTGNRRSSKPLLRSIVYLEEASRFCNDIEQSLVDLAELVPIWLEIYVPSCLSFSCNYLQFETF